MPEPSVRHCWPVFAILIHLVNWSLVWSPLCDMPEPSVRHSWPVFAILIYLANWSLVWSLLCDMSELSARHSWSVFAILVTWSTLISIMWHARAICQTQLASFCHVDSPGQLVTSLISIVWHVRAICQTQLVGFCHLGSSGQLWSPLCDMPEPSVRHCWPVFAILIHLVSWPPVSF